MTEQTPAETGIQESQQQEPCHVPGSHSPRTGASTLLPLGKGGGLRRKVLPAEKPGRLRAPRTDEQPEKEPAHWCGPVHHQQPPGRADSHARGDCDSEV